MTNHVMHLVSATTFALTLVLSLSSCKTGETESNALSTEVAEAAQPYRSCVFGESLDVLKQNSEFTSAEKGEVKRVGRMASIDGKERQFRITEFIHNASGTKFLAFATYLAADDEGNTLGWIEATNGEVVAEIGDGEIFKCQIDTTNVAAIPESPASTCAFGEYIGDLENSKLFAKDATNRQVTGVKQVLANLPIKNSETFTLQEYKHLQSGQKYAVYTTVLSDADIAAAAKPGVNEQNEWPLLAGTLVGWIEEPKSKQVVGEIVSGVIHHCKLHRDGSISTATEDPLLSNCLAAKEWSDVAGEDTSAKKDEGCPVATTDSQITK